MKNSRQRELEMSWVKKTLNKAANANIGKI